MSTHTHQHALASYGKVKINIGLMLCRICGKSCLVNMWQICGKQAADIWQLRAAFGTDLRMLPFNSFDDKE